MAASSPQRLPMVWRGLRVAAVAVVRLLGRWDVRVAGLAHVPERGGAVLAFNHHSYFDFVMVGWDVVRRLERPLRFLAKREIWTSRLAGPIVRMAGAVPVDRDDARARNGAYDAAIAALARGDLVAVAPEQTISPSFELLPFRTGAARMAIAAGVPLVPVVGWGTQRFAAKGHGIHLVRGLPVRVWYGEPITCRPDDDPVEVTARLRERMAAMLRRMQDEYPVAPTAGDDWWAPSRLGGSAPNHDAVLDEHARRFDDLEHGRGQAS